MSQTLLIFKDVASLRRAPYCREAATVFLPGVSLPLDSATGLRPVKKISPCPLCLCLPNEIFVVLISSGW